MRSGPAPTFMSEARQVRLSSGGGRRVDLDQSARGADGAKRDAGKGIFDKDFIGNGLHGILQKNIIECMSEVDDLVCLGGQPAG